ncbi:MAG: thymidine phosphorylase [Planctomycetaceae bacterium]|nr:thymidine phosphorylase [Planctomycetaceae bacterium]MBT4725424.1 thymidine phosphorylase [Planctomycetaceae bacterium]MBT4846542.1 thymidine phosphorylase [Planctomycetaceae bacterium]MBT5123205.1 thymidine phosphorylase [Planctomycetaceae bacterium]MBT5597653.1 thymidine phosphorylase [Planctomycetaceae bacterium]
MNAIEIIRKTRDRRELTKTEIHWFVDRFVQGDVCEPQMAAWAMAVTINGLTPDETYHLTNAMFQSGRTLGIQSDSLLVDKHSTGGVGDKTSLILAPLLACFDVTVPMISGRGLGITGGTLDKLEGIPGFRTNLSHAAIQAACNTIGCVITGATNDIAPADSLLYSLRDITGTVASVELITASILSKKLAEELDCLVFDVKCGSGSSMKSIDQGRRLARSLIDTGRRFAIRSRAVLTDMNQPLGKAVGNTAEVVEAIEAMTTGKPSDLVTLTAQLAYHVLALANVTASIEQINDVITNGETLAKFQQMVQHQGGKLAQLPPITWAPVNSPMSGIVASIDCARLGNLLTSMGGGRLQKNDNLDHGSAIKIDVSVGDRVQRGQIIGHISHDISGDFSSELISSFKWSDTPIAPLPLILETID